MRTWLLVPWVGFSILLFSTDPAEADLGGRREPGLRSVTASRIVRVETHADRLLIAGQNLPRGAGVSVSLGGVSLPVLSSSRSLLVAELPATRPGRILDLVVRRGLQRAVVEGPSLEWALRWSHVGRPPTDEARPDSAPASER